MSDQPENQLDFDAAYGRHRREYQSIRVPLGLGTRIKARARELPPGKRWIRIWRPLTAVAALTTLVLRPVRRRCLRWRHCRAACPRSHQRQCLVFHS